MRLEIKKLKNFIPSLSLNLFQITIFWKLKIRQNYVIPFNYLSIFIESFLKFTIFKIANIKNTWNGIPCIFFMQEINK